MPTASWSLAITPPNRELTISRSLTRWNFQHYVPKIRRRGVFRGRARDRLAPAFPGYIFIIANNAWHTLRSIFGIVDFVARDHPVVEIALISLMKIADADGVIPTPVIISQRFKPGDRVIVNNEEDWRKNGRGEFRHLLENGKALVMLDWLIGQVPAEVDERNLVLEVSEKPKPRRKRRHRRRRRDRSGLAPHVMAA
jgi:hypothetical protein